MLAQVVGMIVDMDTTPDHDGRPRWSAATAAKHCGVSRTTIQRAIAAGRIPGAERGPDGWLLPLSGLIAAGFAVDRPSPPDGDRDHARVEVEQVRAADHLAARVRELEQQLAETRAEAERDRAARYAAEQIAAERDRIIEAQAQALRMLTAGTGTVAPDAMVAPQSPQPPQRSRGLLGRIVDAIGG